MGRIIFCLPSRASFEISSVSSHPPALNGLAWHGSTIKQSKKIVLILAHSGFQDAVRDVLIDDFLLSSKANGKSDEIY